MITNWLSKLLVIDSLSTRSGRRLKSDRIPGFAQLQGQSICSSSLSFLLVLYISDIQHIQVTGFSFLAGADFQFSQLRQKLQLINIYLQTDWQTDRLTDWQTDRLTGTDKYGVANKQHIPAIMCQIHIYAAHLLYRTMIRLPLTYEGFLPTQPTKTTSQRDLWVLLLTSKNLTQMDLPRKWKGFGFNTRFRLLKMP